MNSQLQQQYKYYAFISYSRKNSKAAAYLHKQLEHFRVPIKYVAVENRPVNQKFLRPIFRDRRDLEAGEGCFTDDIKSALEQSRYLIVLCSPESAVSPWVNEEVKHFLAAHNNGCNAIVPIILTGIPGSGGKGECLPESLRLDEIIMRNLPSMLPDEEEGEKAGWENGAIQAMSYMLKVNREKIKATVDSETLRQARVYAYMGVAAAIIFALLAGWAIHAERQAVANEKRAIAGELDAQQQRKRAENGEKLARKNEGKAKEQAEIAKKSLAFLIEILKSSDPLKGGKNKITVMEAIKNKIPDLKHCAPWQLRVSLSKEIASLLDNMGEYGDALLIINEAAVLCKKKQPFDEQTASILNTYASILLSNRDYGHALKIFLDTKEIYELNPKKYLSERARVYNNIAATYMYMKKYEEALNYNQLSLKIRSLQKNQQLALSNSYSTRGLIYYNIKDNSNALKYHQKALQIRQKHCQPQSLTLAESLYFTGLCFYRLSENKKALLCFRKAYSIASQKLGDEHPTTIQYKSVYTKCLMRNSNEIQI